MTFTTRPELRGTVGMVASTHWLASAAGMGMLERGGNAFDAAVAAGFVLQVVEPHLNGPGGEVPILFRRAGGDEVTVLCGQGVAPAAATPARFAELGLDLVPGTGLLAACVPGSFDAWMLLARDHGTMPVDELLAPAIGYAEGGFPVLAGITAAIGGVAELFRDEWTSSAEIYLPGGAPPRAGTFLRNRTLAATYRHIAEAAKAAGDREAGIEAARDAFYRGFVAEAIDSYLARAEVLDTSGERHGGLLTGADLAGWSATFEPSLSRPFAGWTVHKTGPWGQGPVLLQQLALLDGLDLASMDPAGADFVHAVVECAKLALADREAFYGDPRFGDVPIDDLLGREYTDARRALLGESASRELRPGEPGGRAPRLPAFVRAGATSELQAAAGAGEPTVAYSDGLGGDTCHLDVADRFGNVVSATPSGGWLHGSPTVPGLGFCLGTRAQMFWLEEGLPNSLAPGKRPRTTLTPSLAVREDGTTLAFGTPGGDMQDQWSLTFFVRHAAFGMGLQEAIDAPMFHTNHAPDSFWPRGAHPAEVEIESRFAPAVLDELRRRGHELVVGDDWSLGRLSAAGRDPDGTLRAAANPRGMQGYAVGR